MWHVVREMPVQPTKGSLVYVCLRPLFDRIVGWIYHRLYIYWVSLNYRPENQVACGLQAKLKWDNFYVLVYCSSYPNGFSLSGITYSVNCPHFQNIGDQEMAPYLVGKHRIWECQATSCVGSLSVKTWGWSQECHLPQGWADSEWTRTAFVQRFR